MNDGPTFTGISVVILKGREINFNAK